MERSKGANFYLLHLGRPESLRRPEGVTSVSRHSARLHQRGSVAVTFYEIPDSIANGLNCICCFVREFTMEFLFECQQQFHRVEAVSPEVFNEAGAIGYIPEIDR